MRVEFLGQGTLVVRGRDGIVLVDPIFGDAFDAGLRVVSPARDLDVGELPELDAVILTGASAERFDPESVATLPRDAPVLVAPGDGELLTRVLRAAGFTHAHPLHPGDATGIGSVQVFAAEADGRGAILRDGDFRLAIGASRTDGVDLALVHEPELPTLDAYAAFVATCIDQRASSLAPLGGRIDRERFARDAVLVEPAWSGHVHFGDPGDALEAGRVARAELPYCRARTTRSDAGHSPAGVAEREEAFTRASAKGAVAELLETELGGVLVRQSSRFAWHARYAVRQAIEVAFFDGDEGWTVDLASSTPTVTRGPCAAPSMRTRVAAGALLRVVAGTLAWAELVRGGSYVHESFVYRVDPAGLHLAPAGRVPDVLAVLLGREDSLERALVTRLGGTRLGGTGLGGTRLGGRGAP